jgi:hypothetical protein
MQLKHYYLILTLLILGFSQKSFSQDSELSNRLINQMNEITNQTNKNIGLDKPITRNCITSILLEAKKNWDKLTPQAKSVFSPYAARPVITNELIGCSTNFCFHYTLSGADAVPSLDANSNGFPDYVEQMASVFENVWTQYQTRNYTMPPLDGTAGGSNKYDVYIGNLGSGGAGTLYGFVSPENVIGNNPQSASLTEADAMTSWMGMNNNYSWATPITPLNAIKVTAAHEFFHSVQFGTTSSNTNFISEATAAWSEDEIYPGIDDNFQYLSSIFSTPDVALNYNNSSLDGNGAAYNGHWYGAWIFFRYLSEKTNPDIIRQIYTNTITYYEIPAIDNALTATYGTNFNTMFKNYLTSIDVLSSAGTYAPYTYSRATAYKNSLTQCNGICYEKNFNFTGSQLIHSSVTTTSTTSTFGNARLMRLGADYFDITTNQNFKVRCLPTLAGSPIQTILLKYNLTTGTVTKVEGQLIGGFIETSVSDYQNYNAYTLIVYRPDYVANNQNNLNSEQYVFDITQNVLSNESFNDDKIVVYPNPCNSEFFIEGKSFNSYQLINSIGQIVKNSTLDENLETQKISVSDLSDGIYYLKLSSLNGVSNKKIIVKK